MEKTHVFRPWKSSQFENALPWQSRIGVVILSIAIATGVTELLGATVHTQSPFILYFAAVAFSAGYGGFGAGMLATLLGIVLGDLLFIDGKFSLALETPARAIDLIEFLVVSGIINYLSASLRAASAIANRHRHAAEEVARSRDEMISIASHELKTPLTALNLQLDFAAREARRRADAAEDGASLPHLIEGAHEESRRLLRIIDNMLDLARFSAGILTIEPVEANLADIVQRVVQRFRPQLDRAGIMLTVVSGRAVTGRWDPLRIEQVVTNLISNAIKYGGRTPIDISIGGDEENVRLTVRDHGPGISPEDQLRIFRRFERASERHRATSMGLGLFISRQIVECHGGLIELFSRPGEGSTFMVKLPRHPTAATSGGRSAA